MRVGILTVAAALVACGSTPAGQVERPRCDGYAAPVERGRVREEALDEVSGIVASRAHAGVLWAHNDSGDGPRLFALDAHGGVSRGEWVLEGASARDWEDIAIEVIEGGPDRLWIGDIGDNGARNHRVAPRRSIAVLRADEPEPRPAGEAEGARPLAYESIVLRYPDRPRDAEAIAIDPPTGDLLVLTKEAAGPADVFVARAPLDPAAEHTLERIASVELPSMITGADISPDGRELLVRTYRGIAHWTRAEGQGWADALAAAPRSLPHADEPQGEAIAFTAGGDGYITISEGAHRPIWLFARCP